MSGNFSSPSPIQPLNVGNVVSAGLRLYTSHLKDYFLLALRAYLWALVPIYGWAKCYALSALISRLAFGDLVNQPESIASGERYVNSRLWQFFVTMLLTLLIAMGIVVGIVIVFALLGGLSAGLITGLSQEPNPALIALFVVMVFAAIIIAIGAISWLSTRFCLVDVPLAIEENVDGTSTIGRSWELTQGNVWRILLILLIASLITMPVQIAVRIVATIIQALFAVLPQQDSSLLIFPLVIILIGIIIASNAAVLPFWQTIKAVIYYDLRSRREGLGLQLRDREI